MPWNVRHFEICILRIKFACNTHKHSIKPHRTWTLDTTSEVASSSSLWSHSTLRNTHPNFDTSCLCPFFSERRTANKQRIFSAFSNTSLTFFRLTRIHGCCANSSMSGGCQPPSPRLHGAKLLPFTLQLHLRLRWPSCTLRSYCPLFIVVVNKLSSPNGSKFPRF